jgi:hypothetical protein
MEAFAEDSRRIPVVDPMVKAPVEDVVVAMVAESFTVTATPESAVPELFLTVPAALQPQDWPTRRAAATAPIRNDLLYLLEFLIVGFLSAVTTRFGELWAKSAELLSWCRNLLCVSKVSRPHRLHLRHSGPEC